MLSLQNRLAELAASFASDMVDAIRSASLDELAQETGRPASAALRRDRREARTTPLSRQPRRRARLETPSYALSTQDAAVLESIVRLLRVHSNGLRSEDLRAKLKMRSSADHLRRVLKHGITTAVLKSRGAKRATTYRLA